MNLRHINDIERLYLIQKGVLKPNSPEDQRMKIMNMGLFQELNEMLNERGEELCWKVENGRTGMHTRKIE